MSSSTEPQLQLSEQCQVIQQAARRRMARETVEQRRRERDQQKHQSPSTRRTVPEKESISATLKKKHDIEEEALLCQQLSRQRMAARNVAFLRGASICQKLVRTRQASREVRERRLLDHLFFLQAAVRQKVAVQHIAHRRDIAAKGFFLRRLLDQSTNTTTATETLSSFPCLQLLVDAIERPRKKKESVYRLQESVRHYQATEAIHERRAENQVRAFGIRMIQRCARRFMSARVLRDRRRELRNSEGIEEKKAREMERVVAAKEFLPAVQGAVAAFASSNLVKKMIEKKMEKVRFNRVLDKLQEASRKHEQRKRKLLHQLQLQREKEELLLGGGGGGNSPDSPSSPIAGGINSLAANFSFVSSGGGDDEPQSPTHQQGPGGSGEQWLNPPSDLSPLGIRILKNPKAQKQINKSQIDRRVHENFASELQRNIDLQKTNKSAQGKWRESAKESHLAKINELKSKVAQASIEQEKLRQLQRIKKGEAAVPNSPFRSRPHQQPSSSQNNSTATDDNKGNKEISPKPKKLDQALLQEASEAAMKKRLQKQAEKEALKKSHHTNSANPLDQTTEIKTVVVIKGDPCPDDKTAKSGSRLDQSPLLATTTRDKSERVNLVKSATKKVAVEGETFGSKKKPTSFGSLGSKNSSSALQSIGDKKKTQQFDPSSHGVGDNSSSSYLDRDHLPRPQPSLRKVILVPITEEHHKSRPTKTDDRESKPQGDDSVLGGLSPIRSESTQGRQHPVNQQRSGLVVPEGGRLPKLAKEHDDVKRRTMIIQELAQMDLKELEALAERTGVVADKQYQDRSTSSLTQSKAALSGGGGLDGGGRCSTVGRLKDLRNQKNAESQRQAEVKSLSRKKLVGLPKLSSDEKEQIVIKRDRKSWNSTAPAWATQPTSSTK